jgi:hypothetical protein
MAAMIAAKMEPEMETLIIMLGDIEKDSATRFEKLGDFLKNKLTPVIPMAQQWQQHFQQKLK